MAEIEADDPWMSFHVHYTSNPNPLLAEAIGPLVEELQDESLIDGYFFIRYWVEGPHTRLRLKPVQEADRATIEERVHDRIEAFMQSRPAVYEVDREDIADLYHSMFLSEYTQAEWDEAYGAEGSMPIQPNNSIVRARYDPEHGRYGGEEGLAISEWHFEQSSALAIRLATTANMHLRTITFGMSAQLMMVMCTAFLESDEAVVEFLTGYEKYWSRLYVEDSDESDLRYERAVEAMDPSVAAHLRRLGTIGTDDVGAHAAFLQAWHAHCRELRARIQDAAAARTLRFDAVTGQGTFVPDDEGQALRVLLGSYLHMTNNRLGVTPSEEPYMARVVQHALAGRVAETAGVPG